MKKTNKPLFSNGTEWTMWIGHNCERCVKNSSIEAMTFRCSIQRDIIFQAAGVLEEVNIRSYEATQRNNCPYICTERKKRAKKQVDNDKCLFDDV